MALRSRVLMSAIGEEREGGSEVVQAQVSHPYQACFSLHQDPLPLHLLLPGTYVIPLFFHYLNWQQINTTTDI